MASYSCFQFVQGLTSVLLFQKVCGTAFEVYPMYFDFHHWMCSFNWKKQYGNLIHNKSPILSKLNTGWVVPCYKRRNAAWHSNDSHSAIYDVYESRIYSYDRGCVGNNIFDSGGICQFYRCPLSK